VLRDAWFIAREDVKHTVRARETIMWLFIMPVVFFYFIGTITGGFGGRGGGKDRLAVDLSGDAGFLGDEVVRRLETAGYDVVRRIY
jgi:hypothetical protein